MRIGKKLKAERKKRKISQETLAEQLGVSRAALSKWESGETNPPVKALLEFQKFFELEADFFDDRGSDCMTFDVSCLNLSGRLELRAFYDSLVKNKEYLKKP